MRFTHTHSSGDCQWWNYCEERVKDSINRSKYVKKARESLMKKRTIPIK